MIFQLIRRWIKDQIRAAVGKLQAEIDKKNLHGQHVLEFIEYIYLFKIRSLVCIRTKINESSKRLLGRRRTAQSHI